MGKVYQFTVQDEDINKRVDLFLEKQLNLNNEDISRSFIHSNIDYLLINKENKKKNYKIKKKDIIQFTIPDKPEITLIPEDIDFGVIYEDDYLIVVNKPAGLVVHPAKGHYTGTLVHGLLHKLEHSNDNEFYERPGIVHRLDKDTSGLLVVAKNVITQRKLMELFKKRMVDKLYVALVKGKLLSKGEIDKPIIRHPIYRKKFKVGESGKHALTKYNVINNYQNQSVTYSLVEVKLITGRTHQIRVHFSSIGHPVAGDSIYSKISNDFEKQGLALCSKALSFIHPITNEKMNFEIDLPCYFKKMINGLLPIT